MVTIEILRDKWAEFFQSYTNDHSGSLVTVGSEGRGNNRKLGEVEGRELPLRSVVLSVNNKQNALVITIGGRGDDLLTHELRNVSHVRLTQEETDPNNFGSILHLSLIHI